MAILKEDNNIVTKGVGKGGKESRALPWIFIHDTANVYFNKHSLCESIQTLSNHLTVVLCCAD